MHPAMDQQETCSSSTALDPAKELKEMKRQLRLQAQTMKNQIVTLATAISDSSHQATPVPPNKACQPRPTPVQPTVLQPTARPKRCPVPRKYDYESPPLKPQKPKEEPSAMTPHAYCSPEIIPQRSPENGDRPVRQRKEKRPFGTVSETSLPEEMKRCQTVLASLRRQKSAEPFMCPVDAVTMGVPDYYNVILRPMDLGTVSDNLAACKYSSLQEVIDDVALIWENCRLYNGEDHVYSQWATELEEMFQKKMEPILQRFSEEEKERRKVEQHSKKVRREIEELEARIREIKENPDRRLEILALELDGERPVTQEDKQKLRQLIATVDSVTSAKVFSLIQRECPIAMVEREDDVELDLDVLDSRTFRSLEKMVQMAIRKRINEVKKKKTVRGRMPCDEQSSTPVNGAGKGGRSRKPGLQTSPYNSTYNASMPMGFEELPSEAAFGPTSPYTDAESDHYYDEPRCQVRLGSAAIGHISVAAARAGLDLESDGEEEDEEQEEEYMEPVRMGDIGMVQHVGLVQ